jgi:RNA polymerase sigma-70 factor (sigma-E family)
VTASEVGRELSFDELVAANEQRLLRFAVMLTGGRHSAEDLVQTVFTRAYRKWSRISEVDQPEAYLRRMVLNEFLSWRRLLKHGELPVAETRDVPTDEDIGTRQAQRDAVWRLLAGLPRKQRAVLVLRYYEDLPDDEIGKLLDVTPSTVRSNASRALAALRHQLPVEEA